MEISAEDIHQIESIIGSIVGMKPWSVRLGVGSFLTFDFGKAVEKERFKNPIGEWHLWVYMCAWRLETSKDVIIASEDAHKLIQQEIKRLEGKVLQKVTIYAPSLETDLMFETDLRLRLFPIYAQDDDADHWLLFTPGKKVLTIGPSNTWSYADSGEE